MKWKDIPGYEGTYQISDEGIVRSLKFSKEKILKQDTTKKGYKQLNLFKDGNSKKYLVHRLVAAAYLELSLDSEYVVNHIDNNHSNNNINNLEITSSENNVRLYFKEFYKPKERISVKQVGSSWQVKITRNFKTFEEAEVFKLKMEGTE